MGPWLSAWIPWLLWDQLRCGPRRLYVASKLISISFCCMFDRKEKILMLHLFIMNWFWRFCFISSTRSMVFTVQKGFKIKFQITQELQFSGNTNMCFATIHGCIWPARYVSFRTRTQNLGPIPCHLLFCRPLSNDISLDCASFWMHDGIWTGKTWKSFFPKKLVEI